jgi:glycosidase
MKPVATQWFAGFSLTMTTAGGGGGACATGGGSGTGSGALGGGGGDCGDIDQVPRSKPVCPPPRQERDHCDRQRNPLHRERFAGNRLPQLVDWLDYLAELGITALLLGPIFESETHGYDVVDPFRVDRRLGTEEDLVQLIDECHRRSLRVALDVVFHHVGRGHGHFRDVLAKGSQSAWRDWFEIDFGRPGRDGFAYANFEGHDHLVKLNHTNRAVLDWAVDVARYWVDRGIDAFRLDAAYALPPAFVAAFAGVLAALSAAVTIAWIVAGEIAANFDRAPVFDLLEEPAVEAAAQQPLDAGMTFGLPCNHVS